MSTFAALSRLFWWYGCLQRTGIVPDATGNLKAVQKLLGHESIQTTGDIYTDWDVEQLAKSLLEAVQDDEIGIVPQGAPGERLG